MGRFDGPHFRNEENNLVSVWVAKCPFHEIPDDYFNEPNDDDDDAPWNDFSSDFGFGYYDLDFIEPNHADGNVVSIRELILPCSYGASFVQSVTNRAAKLGIADTSFVFLMYNFRYDPMITGKQESRFLRFIGVFDYETST